MSTMQESRDRYQACTEAMHDDSEAIEMDGLSILWLCQVPDCGARWWD